MHNITQLGINLLNVEQIQFDGIDYTDYPKFCDAYISSARYEGRELTELELEDINDNQKDFVGKKLWQHLT